MIYRMKWSWLNINWWNINWWNKIKNGKLMKWTDKMNWWSELIIRTDQMMKWIDKILIEFVKD